LVRGDAEGSGGLPRRCGPTAALYAESRLALAPRARVGLFRNLPRHARELAHDVVARAALDDLLDIRRDMSRRTGEQVRARPDLLVRPPREIDAPDAFCAAALTEEIGRLGPPAEARRHVLDPFVDVAENRLVQADALLAACAAHVLRGVRS